MRDPLLFATLASGSSGNSALLRYRSTAILIDAGRPIRELSASLASLGTPPESLSAIVLTHAHRDHICSAAALSRRYHLPIYTHRTAAEDLTEEAEKLIFTDPRTPLQVGDVTITALRASHDAPCRAYRFDTDAGSFGFATDLGYISRAMTDYFACCRAMVLESNYDPDLLAQSRYPLFLRRRIASDKGHLSNCECARFAVYLAEHGMQAILLSHLSEENNTPDLARQTVCDALEKACVSMRVEVAERFAPTVLLQENLPFFTPVPQDIDREECVL